MNGAAHDGAADGAAVKYADVGAASVGTVDVWFVVCWSTSRPHPRCVRLRSVSPMVVPLGCALVGTSLGALSRSCVIQSGTPSL